MPERFVSKFSLEPDGCSDFELSSQSLRLMEEAKSIVLYNKKAALKFINEILDSFTSDSISTSEIFEGSNCLYFCYHIHRPEQVIVRYQFQTVAPNMQKFLKSNKHLNNFYKPQN